MMYIFPTMVLRELAAVSNQLEATTLASFMPAPPPQRREFDA